MKIHQGGHRGVPMRARLVFAHAESPPPAQDLMVGHTSNGRRFGLAEGAAITICRTRSLHGLGVNRRNLIVLQQF